MSASSGGELYEATAELWLSEGQQHEFNGRVAEAIECYGTAVEIATGEHYARIQSEALRRLGLLHHFRGEQQVARDFCQRSYEVAKQAGVHEAVAEALNTLAGLEYEGGFYVPGTRDIPSGL